MPLETILLCNLSFVSLQKFLVDKPFTPFWAEVFTFWCSFHYVDCKTDVSSTEVMQEILARPAYFNSAFGSMVRADKRWSESLQDYFLLHHWISVVDIVALKADHFPQKGFITKQMAINIVKSVPSQWRKAIIPDNPAYALAQNLLIRNCL